MKPCSSTAGPAGKSLGSKKHLHSIAPTSTLIGAGTSGSG